jgi:hypothetical protein
MGGICMAEVIRKPENSIEMTVGIWRDIKTNNIHFKLPHGKLSYVSDNKNSVRHHPHLYKTLREILEIEDRW